MDTLAPEHRPIVGAARRRAGCRRCAKAVAEEQERARAEGRPSVSGEAIVALAEGLLPEVKAALWLDRAEAAASHLDELSLRDLRATVLTATARDDRGRELERQLREALEQRVTKLRSDWEQQLEQALSRGRALEALRLSARTPEPTARFPAGLIERLAAQAGAAMTPDLPPGEWLSAPRRRRRMPGPQADQAGRHPRGSLRRGGAPGAGRRRADPGAGSDARHDDAAPAAATRRAAGRRRPAQLSRPASLRSPGRARPRTPAAAAAGGAAAVTRACSADVPAPAR